VTELGLRIPVEGVQLIEASAGTGKTFTVATLYTRLVVELGLPVSKLLAVTYTEAAAKDLRDKLRERLARAAALVEGLPAEDAADALAPRAGEAAADATTRALLAAALARGEALHALRQRLRLAVAQMDLAPIHTIHGFCQRALREHALAAGQPLATRALVANEASLRREVAIEFWRRHVDDADAIGGLLAIWKSPEALAKELQELLGFDALLPPPATVDLRAARAAFAQAFDAGGTAAFELLREAREQGAVSKTFSKDEQLAAVFTALLRWRAKPLEGDPACAELRHFGTRYLQDKRLKKLPPPEHPFFDAIDAYLDAQRAARVNLVHAAVDFARARLAELKRERALVGFDDLIRELADALEGAQGDALAEAMQQQYAVALVDEFQDTDPRQWRIFERLFARRGGDGELRALFLIGDPKQAIYRFRGGDVATYIIAKRQAQDCHRLERNFRSRPLALQATAALFDMGGAGAFDQPDIEFEPVQAGGACLDAHFQRDGADAPALYVQQLAANANTPAEDVRRQLALNCVAAIHALLAEAQAGRNLIAARRSDGTLDTRPVRPGDITVLVGRNDDALRMQRALSDAGIPSVAAGRASLYESEEARDVHAFLAALAAPADDGRLRALLATPLFGLDAAAIAAFDTDLAAHRRWQDEAQHWLATALRRGAMAALAGVCARESARILAQAGGERRLSNYLQLVEELQAAEAGATGLAGLHAELERRMQDADKNNDAELVRLESDAARVKVMTTHVSKGLNLDLVFVPFAAMHSGGNTDRRAPRRAHYHEGNRRVAKLFAQGSAEPEVVEDADEEFAEQVRVLYVALTRARFATWIGWGLCRDVHKTPLAWLLHRSGETRPGKLDSLQIERALARLLAQAPGAIELLPSVSAEVVAALPRLRFEASDTLPPARLAARALDRDWWVYSFSQLAREDSGAEVRGAEDEAEPPPLQRQRFAGTRFGNALHGALEEVRFADWHGWEGVLPPPGQLEPVREALRREGFASEADLDDGLPLLTQLIAATLNTRLPEGTVLATRPPETLCVEMEFHLELAPVTVPALLALLHRHGLVDARRGFGLRARLEGLLTGRMDLVYESGGRYYVLDYKSNLLPDYGAESVARSVREHEYDLQYLLYTLALHRWLRFRLGAAYDIAQHLGGVRYVFCRGLDPSSDHSPGVHALRLPDELVLALDALLATPREVAA
jgi:exodeoxyribonuclease V beta subunit